MPVREWWLGLVEVRVWKLRDGWLRWLGGRGPQRFRIEAGYQRWRHVGPLGGVISGWVSGGVSGKAGGEGGRFCGFIRPEIIGDQNQRLLRLGRGGVGNVMPQPVFNSASAKPRAKPSVRFMVFTVPPKHSKCNASRTITVPENPLGSALFSPIFVGLPLSYSGEAM